MGVLRVGTVFDVFEELGSFLNSGKGGVVGGW